MRVSYTRQIGDVYEMWQAETTEERESEVHASNVVELLFRRITAGPQTVDATSFGEKEKTELPVDDIPF